MMKWKARTETVNSGIIELGNLTFDEECIMVRLDIYSMSEDLQAEVNKAIGPAKKEDVKSWDDGIVSIPPQRDMSAIGVMKR